MRLRLSADPAENEVNRRNQFDLHRIRVERILAGSERGAPDAAMTGLHLFAVAKRFTCRVRAGDTVIRNYHTDVPDRDQRLGLYLHRAEPAIDEECAVRQPLQLFTTAAAQLQERFRILEVIMIPLALEHLHFRRDDLT